jgi:hypothetical protein
MCTIALILSGLASIPFTDTRQPWTFPFYTPNKHFSGFNFSYALRMLVKVSTRSSICVVFSLTCHHNVVIIRENISLHLFFEDGLHHPTEHWAGILVAFGHPEVTIGVERHPEPDLMVPREII